MYTAAVGRHRSTVSHRSRAVAAMEASLLARVHRVPSARVIDGRGRVTRVPALRATRSTSRGRRSARNPDWSTVSELELRDRLLTLDGAAWREFHKRYDKIVTASVAKVVGGPRHDSGAVDDARGNVYAMLLANDMAKLRAWDPAEGRRLGSYLHVLAAWAAKDYYRRGRTAVRKNTRSAQFGVEDDDGESIGMPFVDPSVDAFTRTASRAELRRTLATLATLTAIDQEIAELRFVDDLSPAEIAERLGVQANTVYTRIDRVRSKLEAARVAV